MLKENVFFGARKVAANLKTGMVDSLFSKVATKYDMMNDMMSMGVHRIWKDSFAYHMDNPNASVLDVAGGTCDIAKRFAKFYQENAAKSKITVYDLNFEMLKAGEEKMLNSGILGLNYVCGAAENLPFDDNSFDYYSVSFGVRNFTDIEASLQEAKRVLKKGGKYMCMEFSKPKHELLSKVYKIYSDLVIPSLGAALGDRDSYQYLVESIEKFPGQDEFREMIIKAGFKNVAYRNLSDGIVAIHTAYKL